MVEKIEIQIDKKKQVNKYAKVKPIILICILVAYIIAVVTTIIVFSVKSSKPGMAYTSHGNIDTGITSRYFCDIKLYNLKADGSTIELNIDEFELYRSGNQFRAYGFMLVEDSDEIYTSNEIKIVRNSTEKTVRIFFEPGSGFMSNIYDNTILYYAGERIDTRVTAEALRGEEIGFIATETIAALIIWAIIFAVLNARSASVQKSHIYKNINEKVLDELKTKKFNITKEFYLSTPKTGLTNLEKLMVCVDSKAKKCCFVDYNKRKMFVVDFADIVSHKVIENNGVRVEEEFPFFGMPATQTTKNVCKKLSLVIVIDDIDDTNVVYDLIKSGVSIDSKIYKDCSSAVVEVTSFLEVIKNKKHTEEKRFVYCSYCGAKNKGESLRCESCGSPLKD